MTSKTKTLFGYPVEVEEEQLLDTSHEALEEFYKDHDVLTKEVNEDGSIVAYGRKKRKCKHCVSWISIGDPRIGACGDEDHNRRIREEAVQFHKWELDDPDVMVIKMMKPDESCVFFRSKRRTWGGRPLDERKSALLDEKHHVILERETKMKSKVEDQLEGWAEVAQKAAEDRRREQTEFNEKLREPDVVFEQSEGYKYGYWHLPGNEVGRMRLLNNGQYDHHSLRIFGTTELELLSAVQQVKPKDYI